jgi:hypothetical protein
VLTKDDERYREGYLRVPETPEELDDIRALAVQAMLLWDPWPAEEPPSVSRRTRLRRR